MVVPTLPAGVSSFGSFVLFEVVPIILSVGQTYFPAGKTRDFSDKFVSKQ